MERQNGNISPHKAGENGIKGKPPYSVETPYGFQLDLDFLKYVDDIEKGNTIKRVPIQRRSKGPRASTLPRHPNPSGSGYRPSAWGSTGALGPRSRVSDGHHHGSWAYDHRPPLSPTGLISLVEMEARIKEFDEQPLGEHIRPHLLRASSLPLTVLLRQGSESTDDGGSLRSSRDCLGGRNTSCEDVFLTTDNAYSQDCSGLLRRLTEARERVGELEMEVRVIPELRAQVSFLQEERERLRMNLNPHSYSSSMNGSTDPCKPSHYKKVDIKRPRHEGHVAFPRNHCNSSDDSTHEWRSSTDLDELLTVTSLQAKVAVLEQKLHEAGQELQRVTRLLREQQEETRRKDEKIEHLSKNPAVFVRAERVVVDQDGEETVVRSTGSDRNKVSFTCTRTANVNGQGQQDSTVSSSIPLLSVEPVGTSAETKVAIHHVQKIKSLLDQQWRILCAESESREETKLLKHPDPKVNNLQEEMMRLVDVLASHYKQRGQADGRHFQHGASKSTLRTEGCTQTSNRLLSEGANDGFETRKKGSQNEQDSLDQHVHGDVGQSGSSGGGGSPQEMAAVQMDAEAERRAKEGERKAATDRQMMPTGTGSCQTHGRTALVQAEATQGAAKSKTQATGEQTEGSSDSETSTRVRETVSADFMAACHFLKDHMDNMDNPKDDMRKALIVLFQHWFSVAAEESSVPSTVSLYLKEVKKAAPTLLAFLVNLADNNSNTVLHYSVSHCNYDIVSLLLDTGVIDINIQNDAGYTAVMLASLTAPDGPGGMEVVRKLMELGSINIRSRETGQTALHLAVRHGRVVMVRLLLSFGADANIQDTQGTTALMFASERGHTHIARLLLERSQCDLTLTDKQGQTALSIAMQGSHTDTAALLQAHAKARAL
ncbi:unnamed protein product [Ophioblennius macclurei]